MFNLSKTKEQLNKLTNHLSLGILGTVAAIAPQSAESQERQIEEVVVSATKHTHTHTHTDALVYRNSLTRSFSIYILPPGRCCTNITRRSGIDRKQVISKQPEITKAPGFLQRLRKTTTFPTRSLAFS